MNWSTVTLFGHDTQSCMDPNVLEAKVVVSACGHDGPFGATGVKRLQELGLVDKVPGMAALDMNKAEDAVVANTREVYPGMIITGMEVAGARLGGQGSWHGCFGHEQGGGRRGGKHQGGVSWYDHHRHGSCRGGRMPKNGPYLWCHVYLWTEGRLLGSQGFGKGRRGTQHLHLA